MELDPKLPTMMGIAAALDILIPIVLVLWLRRKLGTKWVVFGLGALAFGVSQILTRVPIVIATQAMLKDSLKDPVVLFLFTVALAITAGLFEETARYVCYAKGLKQESNWKNAVSLGAGHGGIEAALFVGGLMLVGVINTVVIFNLDVDSAKLSAEQIAKINEAKATIAGTDWWSPLLGVWERISAIGMHLAFSVMVLQAYVRKQWRWYWLAVGAHAVSNAVAVLVMKQFGGLAAELVLTGFFALAIWFVLRMRDRSAPPQTRAAPA